MSKSYQCWKISPVWFVTEESGSRLNAVGDFSGPIISNYKGSTWQTRGRGVGSCLPTPDLVHRMGQRTESLLTRGQPYSPMQLQALPRCLLSEASLLDTMAKASRRYFCWDHLIWRSGGHFSLLWFCRTFLLLVLSPFPPPGLLPHPFQKTSRSHFVQGPLSGETVPYFCTDTSDLCTVPFPREKWDIDRAGTFFLVFCSCYRKWVKP